MELSLVLFYLSFICQQTKCLGASLLLNGQKRQCTLEGQTAGQMCLPKATRAWSLCNDGMCIATKSFSKFTPGEWEVLHDTHAAYFSSRGHDELTGCLQHMVAMRKKA